MSRKSTAVGLVLAHISFAALAAEPRQSPQESPESIGPAPQLDLKAPELTRIFSLAEINAILSRAVDPALEHVEVEALRLGDLPFDDNSASTGEVIFRSILQLFAPSQSYAANVNLSPDATDPYRPAPPMMTNYHASFPPPVSQR